ncbi:MAG: polyprenyl synthetase family protein [Hyphomicrobiales bacterium]
MTTDNFETKLEKAVKQVENGLKAHLASDDETPETLLEAMRYASLDGGKRLRPFLVNETASLFKADQQLVTEAAIAIECIHCYSLIHDDLPSMDNDELRRGRPTLWKHSDEATAILAGDSLQTLAFEILSNAPTLTNSYIKSQLINGLAKAVGKTGMVGGQIRDMAAEKSSEVNFADILMIHSQKTGALISFAAEAGAIIGGADHHAREAIKLFGQKLGLAFQLKDDLLDVEGTTNDLGKTAGKDQASGKATLVSILGHEKAVTFLSNLKDGALYALEPFGEKAETLREATRFVCERQN